MKKQRGFSLIELLIVVAIILIIAAIAIPNLIRAHIAANESSAVAGVRTITTAEATFSTQYPQGFSDILLSLGPNGADCTDPSKIDNKHACILDGVLAVGAKSGYNFTAPGVKGAAANFVNFVATGVPIGLGSTGTRAFCASGDLVLRVQLDSDTVAADVNACTTTFNPL